MSFETRIGWRYLYSRRADDLLLKLAGGSAVVSLAGLGVLLATGPSVLGLLSFVLGLIMTAVFLLLSLFSVFTSVSVLGVSFGVAALTIVLAVTTGFQQQFRDKVLGVNAHVIVMKAQATFDNYRDVMKTALEIDPDVISAQPFIYTEMLVTRGTGQIAGVGVKGVDPKLFRGVLDLERYMIQGSVESLGKPRAADEPPPLIIGKELALKLKAKMGDIVTIVVPLSNLDLDTYKATTTGPHTQKYRISGIFYCGFDEYDRRLMYASLKDIQDLIGRGDQVLGIELKLKDIDKASEVARKLDHKLGPPYQVQDWYELNESLFTALNLQKLVLVILLTLIILVASVNMVSALIMMVTDKTREIAILKSMGATSGSVAKVFIVVGLAIGGVGMSVGVLIGLAFCFVASRYGYHLDPKVYLIDRLPIDVHFFEVGLVCVITLVISILATIVPAWNASSLRPVEGLRYD
ncbi:MAG TPA: ABC transporter permease [Kofleriaceae bacterium]